VGDVQGIRRGGPFAEARVDAIGWGVLLVIVGGVLLAPGLPTDAWLVAAGAVMVATSIVRAVLGLAVSWITAVVGTARLSEVELDHRARGRGGPLVLIALGTAVRPLGSIGPIRGDDMRLTTRDGSHPCWSGSRSSWPRAGSSGRPACDHWIFAR
jgi:hypothetical protein